MRKLGQGWQVTVHEYSAQRVYKKPQRGFSAYTSILKDFPAILLHPQKLYTWVKDLQRKQKQSLKYISKRVELSHLIGNPTIEIAGGYYQDKVIPIKEYIQRLSWEAFTKLVDDFTEFNYQLFEKGMIDKSFNFTKNYGIDSHGKLILIDLGELFFDSKEIREQIKRKPWARPQFLKKLSREQREYFLRVMEQRFLEN